MPFIKAVRTQARLRLAIDGPTGAGKTYTGLIAATVMADGGKIAVLDTEAGSASLYSDEFNFDVQTITNFSPKNYIAAIHEAEEGGYPVMLIDSLTHAWDGEGGALDMVDMAAKRSQSKNTYTAWRDVTPLHRRLVDAMLQSKMHIVATMRSKMEYALEATDGKNSVRKLGLAPIQRQGMEYEFTFVCDMDTDHNLTVSKSRWSPIDGDVVNRPDAKWFGKIQKWLTTASPEQVQSPVEEEHTQGNLLSFARTYNVSPQEVAEVLKANNLVPFNADKWEEMKGHIYMFAENRVAA